MKDERRAGCDKQSAPSSLGGHLYEILHFLVPVRILCNVSSGQDFLRVDATVSNSFGPNELALLHRIVDLAAADLNILDEEEKSMIAARVIAAAERGAWDLDLLLAHAKGNISHVA